MFVTIVLNTEYMDTSYRIKWYLKNLYHAKKNGWLVITHESLYKNFETLQKTVDNRFFDEFEMKALSIDDINSIDQYLIPDEIFDRKLKESGSRTEMLFDIAKNRFPEFEYHINTALDQFTKNHKGNKIEGVFHVLEGFKSLRTICNNRKIPLINYVFSAIRKVHGYQQTLFSANIDDRLYCGNECEKRYNTFINENKKKDISLLENREIIALIGKERTLPLIKLLNYEPTNEMFICGDAYQMIPHVFEFAKYTDEDIYFECNRIFQNDLVKYRQHPMQLNQVKIDNSEVRNDPAIDILSCKRVSAVVSQIVLKALLWNRTAIMKKNTLPFSFMCGKNYDSETKVNLEFLNYYLFGYLVPSEFMFSQEYWRWRLTSPAEAEIYIKHLSFYLSKLNIEKHELFEENKNSRFKFLLKARKCAPDLIDILLSEDNNLNIDFNVATSKLEVNYRFGTDTTSEKLWRLNEYKNGTIRSRFSVNFGERVSRMVFYPLDDKAGFVNIERINLLFNKQNVQTIFSNQGWLFYPKNVGSFEIVFPNDIPLEFEIECIWKYKTISSGLNDNELC